MTQKQLITLQANSLKNRTEYSKYWQNSTRNNGKFLKYQIFPGIFSGIQKYRV